MQKHTQIYLKAFGYSEGDFIPSEISGTRAVDINHIECRGMGGNPSKDKDRIENLMAVTREEHIAYGDMKEHTAYLLIKHRDFMDQNGVKYDKQYMASKIGQYSNSNELSFT